MATVLITLTVAGSDTGPFNLYSNVDGFAVPFEVSVDKLDLEAGFTSTLVPDVTSVIRVQSMNPICNNYIDLEITGSSPTTTTTSSSSSTTTTSSSTSTTTTSSTSTTTTTTTIDCGECWNVQNESGVQTAVVEYLNCFGAVAQATLLPGAQDFICSPSAPICISGCELISIIQDTGNNCEPECPSLG